MKSTAVDGERFFVKTRFEKWRNTLCISHFSNRRIGGKDPASAVADLFRGPLVQLKLRLEGGLDVIGVDVRPGLPSRPEQEGRVHAPGKSQGNLRMFMKKFGKGHQIQLLLGGDHEMQGQRALGIHYRRDEEKCQK